MKKYFALAMLFFATFSVFAQNISLEDVVNYRYMPRRISGLRPMADGESYSKISDDGKKILRCSYKTGEVTETLLDLTTARGKKLDRFSNYIISPDGKNILIGTNQQAIYRHSATATYYIYNVRNHTLEPLSKNGNLQEVPKFSPDGTMIAFIRDNNLFL
ncbi:MAG: DPP IV N-terminal domain-containing protein, partial [Bacteroidaceae bacterium]|nr:DPP IV N-terminal domain-containing protein [Bacteroidaceae bacterium]